MRSTKKYLKARHVLQHSAIISDEKSVLRLPLFLLNFSDDW